MPQLVTAKSHRHTPAQIKATTSSLYQQLHTATSLTFNNSTFTFPLAALSLGLERGKEQSKSSSRVAAGGLGSRTPRQQEQKIKGEALLIPSDSRSTLNLQTNSTSPRGIPALSLSGFRLPLLKITCGIQILTDDCPPSPSCKSSL